MLLTALVIALMAAAVALGGVAATAFGVAPLLPDPSALSLKWPNDLVVVDGEGLRKLGGLLVEGGGEVAGAARAAAARGAR